MARSQKKTVEYEPVSSALFRSKEEIEQEEATPSLVDMSPEQEHTRTNAHTYVRMSYNIREEQDMSLEEIQRLIRIRDGKKPTKSELVEEAIDLLIGKYQA